MGTVRITYFDREAAYRAVLEHVRSLADSDPDVEEVILFGSLAAGRPVPGSDADLLIVLRRSDRPFLDRIALYAPTDVPIPVDVFPYTREEMERMSAEGNAFIRSALTSGIPVFRRAEQRAHLSGSSEPPTGG